MLCGLLGLLGLLGVPASPAHGAPPPPESSHADVRLVRDLTHLDGTSAFAHASPPPVSDRVEVRTEADPGNVFPTGSPLVDLGTIPAPFVRDLGPIGFGAGAASAVAYAQVRRLFSAEPVSLAATLAIDDAGATARLRTSLVPARSAFSVVTAFGRFYAYRCQWVTPLLGGEDELHCESMGEVHQQEETLACQWAFTPAPGEGCAEPAGPFTFSGTVIPPEGAWGVIAEVGVISSSAVQGPGEARGWAVGTLTSVTAAPA